MDSKFQLVDYYTNPQQKRQTQQRWVEMQAHFKTCASCYNFGGPKILFQSAVEKKHVGLLVPASVRDEIEKVAAEQGMTIDQVIAAILDQWRKNRYPKN